MPNTILSMPCLRAIFTKRSAGKPRQREGGVQPEASADQVLLHVIPHFEPAEVRGNDGQFRNPVEHIGQPVGRAMNGRRQSDVYSGVKESNQPASAICRYSGNMRSSSTKKFW